MRKDPAMTNTNQVPWLIALGVVVAEALRSVRETPRSDKRITLTWDDRRIAVLDRRGWTTASAGRHSSWVPDRWRTDGGTP